MDILILKSAITLFYIHTGCVVDFDCIIPKQTIKEIFYWIWS